MPDVAPLLMFAAVSIALAILLAAFFMTTSGVFIDSHFGRGVAATVGVGAILVWLASELDPGGLITAVVVWFATIVLVGAYGIVLDAWAWLRGDYNA